MNQNKYFGSSPAKPVRNEKIGSVTLENPFIQAPMAGITNLSTRIIARQLGCSLTCGEMISSNALIRGNNKTQRLLSISETERPVSLQIFGADPEIMTEAAVIVQESGVDILDINLGCAVRKVNKSGAGAALLKNLSKAEKIIKSVRRKISVPLTIKMRLGWNNDDLTFLKLGEIAQDCGVDAVILHARTAAQGFSGNADWSKIAELKNRLRIPVIGNGDVNSPKKALEMLDQTGCDAVMIGRGALGNPWIYRESNRLLQNGTTAEKTQEEIKAVMINHFNMALEGNDVKKAIPAFRKHMAWYSKGLPGGSKFRKKVFHSTNQSEIINLIERLFDGSI